MTTRLFVKIAAAALALALVFAAGRVYGTAAEFNRQWEIRNQGVEN